MKNKTITLKDTGDFHEPLSNRKIYLTKNKGGGLVITGIKEHGSTKRE